MSPNLDGDIVAALVQSFRACDMRVDAVGRDSERGAPWSANPRGTAPRRTILHSRVGSRIIQEAAADRGDRARTAPL